MKCSFLCIVLFLNFNCFAQKNDFQFVVEKIIQNYSGFQDKSDSAKFTRFAQAVMSQNSQDTFKALTIITDFFKDKHLAIRENVPNPNIDRSSCQMQYSKVLTYLNGSQKKKQFEGFWLNDYNDCVIGIMQTGSAPKSYKAFVIEAIDTSFVKGLILLNFEKRI